jgi:small subunit ribosomal protein S7
LKRDKDAAKYAPKVMRDQMAWSIDRRSYFTSAWLRNQDMQQQVSAVDQNDPSVSVVADMIAAAGNGATVPERKGYKFDMPELPLPRSENMKRRYDPLVEQFTKLLMRHGKLSAAQKVS